MSTCFTCNRTMIIKKGNICKTCYEQIQYRTKVRMESEMIASTIGEFSLFEDGVKPKRFNRSPSTMRSRNFKRDPDD